MTMQTIIYLRRYSEFVAYLRDETTCGIETETVDNEDGTFTRLVYCGGQLEERRTYRMQKNPVREDTIRMEVSDDSSVGKWACKPSPLSSQT